VKREATAASHDPVPVAFKSEGNAQDVKMILMLDIRDIAALSTVESVMNVTSS